MYGMGEEGKVALKNAMKAVSEHYVNIDSLKKMKDNQLLQHMFTHYFPQKILDRYKTGDVDEYMTWFINKESISDAGQVDSNSDLPLIVSTNKVLDSKKNYSNNLLPPITRKPIL